MTARRGRRRARRRWFADLMDALADLPAPRHRKEKAS